MPYIGNQPSDLVVPTPTVDTFTGNGSQDNYTLVRAVNNAALLEVFVDNFPYFAVNVEKKCPKCGYLHDIRYTDFASFFY